MRKYLIYLLLLFQGITITSMGQETLTLTGKVVSDSSGQPLESVTVKLKETGQATLTNAKGEFSLSTTLIKGTLLFSAIAFEPTEREYTGAMPIFVTLHPK